MGNKAGIYHVQVNNAVTHTSSREEQEAEAAEDVRWAVLLHKMMKFPGLSYLHLRHIYAIRCVQVLCHCTVHTYFKKVLAIGNIALATTLLHYLSKPLKNVSLSLS